jgi:predicted ATPase
MRTVLFCFFVFLGGCGGGSDNSTQQSTTPQKDYTVSNMLISDAITKYTEASHQKFKNDITLHNLDMQRRGTIETQIDYDGYFNISKVNATTTMSNLEEEIITISKIHPIDSLSVKSKLISAAFIEYSFYKKTCSNLSTTTICNKTNDDIEKITDGLYKGVYADLESRKIFNQAP